MKQISDHIAQHNPEMDKDLASHRRYAIAAHLAQPCKF
jgi:hypothetical protein